MMGYRPPKPPRPDKRATYELRTTRVSWEWRSLIFPTVLAVAALLIGVSRCTAAEAGVSAAISGPTTAYVGEIVELRIEITETGPAINAYQAELRWDPTRGTFLGLSSAGSIIVGPSGEFVIDCPRQEPGRRAWAHVALGPVWSTITGPGLLSTVSFRVDKPGLLGVALAGACPPDLEPSVIAFALAGIDVPTASSNGCSVEVLPATVDVAPLSTWGRIRALLGG